MTVYDIVNYKDIRESLALLLKEKIDKTTAKVILESLDDILGNNAEYLVVETTQPTND